MASWKKIIVSGSNAELNQITSSAGINIKTVGSLSNGISSLIELVLMYFKQTHPHN